MNVSQFKPNYWIPLNVRYLRSDIYPRRVAAVGWFRVKNATCSCYISPWHRHYARLGNWPDPGDPVLTVQLARRSSQIFELNNRAHVDEWSTDSRAAVAARHTVEFIHSLAINARWTTIAELAVQFINCRMMSSLISSSERSDRVQTTDFYLCRRRVSSQLD